MKKIAVLGAGTWGLALARLLFNNGHDMIVWSWSKEEVDLLKKTGNHPKLPKMKIPKGLEFTSDLEEAARDRDIFVMAVPSVGVRSTARSLSPFIRDGHIIVDVAKGIEKETHFTMTEIIRDELDKNCPDKKVSLVALSGPTHAEEVSIDMPTAIVSASEDAQVAKTVQDVFMSENFRVYTNSDVKGVELCGALKNIIALASGISTGLGYGDNARAALITRGMAEIRRLGSAAGCEPETFMGLAGIGDLIVTATSQHSRNNNCGFLIGQGLTPKQAVDEVGMVVEGINAIPAAMELSKMYDIEIPICEAVNNVIFNNADPAETVRELMTRDKKSEDYYD